MRRNRWSRETGPCSDIHHHNVILAWRDRRRAEGITPVLSFPVHLRRGRDDTVRIDVPIFPMISDLDHGFVQRGCDAMPVADIARIPAE